MLEQSDIAHYLLSLGLVKPRDVVDKGLRIVDASRRNSVFLAATCAGPTYVVKQAGPRTAHTLAHEAAVIDALAEVKKVAAHVPTVILHEPEEARLVLRTPAAARDWCHHSGRFPRIPARALGRVLAAVHRTPASHVERMPPGVDPMWGLSLSEPSYELLLDLSFAAQDVVARLQASPMTCERLEAVRATGSADGLVHGDLRWDNCLSLAAPNSQRRTRVLLVDWELSGAGAAAFDIGTVIAEYLRVWVASIPIVEPSNPGRLLAQARYPLAGMRPAIHAFWSAYRLANPLHPSLRRVIELAAVRLLQAAVEHAQDLTTPSAHVVTLVQLADNMLRDPEGAALSLLALRD
jgi:Ser/Thr protein kinase RdoA (MazF antagonist)